jgi:UDP-N-acetylmuramate dehydrogenase
MKNPILKINYGTVRNTLEETGKKEFTIRDVSDAIIKIRSSKLPDPEKVGNAGSFFKNPVIPHSLFREIKKSYATIPFFDQPNEMVKVPAAWLIEQCGLKGIKHHGAAVHHLQPLVLINQKNATGADVVALAQKIQKRVTDRFGIHLEPEVTVI